MGTIRIVYNASNTFTAPPGVTSAFVECEGAGGGGGNGGSVGTGGGGGGGAYAASTLTLVPGTTYAVTVGTGGAVATAGTSSSFGSNLVVAAAGAGGTTASGLGSGAAGSGGTTANSTGQTTTAGGNGSGQNAGQGAPPIGNATDRVGDGGQGGAALGGAGQVGGPGTVYITFDYTTDALGANDTVQMVVNWTRAFNETVAASDGLAKSILRPLSETATVSDSLSKIVVKKFQNEDLLASDSFMKAYEQIHSEALSLADFAKVILVYLRSFSDVPTAADALAKTMALAPADAVAAVDAVFRLTIKKFSDEQAMISDLISMTTSFARLPEDTLAASESSRKNLTVRFGDSISGNGSPVVDPTPTQTIRKIYIISD